MSHHRAYRLTARKVQTPEVEQRGHTVRNAITLGQWDERDDALSALRRYVAANPVPFAAGAANTRLVITEV